MSPNNEKFYKATMILGGLFSTTFLIVFIVSFSDLIQELNAGRTVSELIFLIVVVIGFFTLFLVFGIRSVILFRINKRIEKELLSEKIDGPEM